MSEVYEGVVVLGEPTAVRSAFNDLRSPLALRLVRFAEPAFGLYRGAGRDEPFDPAGVAEVARQMAVRLGAALAVFYDNRGGTREAVLYTPGGVREFGEADEWWVPLDEGGMPAADGPRLRADQLDADAEYDCVVSAIDAGLAALGVPPEVNAAALKQAFCYGERD